MNYADLLSGIGQRGAAYEYLLEALSYDIEAPFLDSSFASIGIPIALHMKDEATLALCTRLSAMDSLLQCGQPSRISSVTAAFAEWHAACGRKDDARQLLHDAVQTLVSVEQLVNWEFPISVARFGSHADVPSARKFLKSRATMPGSDITQAALALFDAFVDERNQQFPQAYHHAADAAQRFTALGWHGYADLARMILPATLKAPVGIMRDQKPFSDMFALLTAREQQVAELVLKGSTNRAIAEKLSIKENTVETHMASIMNRLGIRSRHQLVNILADTEI